MNGKRAEEAQRTRRPEDTAERRFNETVRNLLNTPPKPHKDKGISKPLPKPKHGSKDPNRR